MNAPICAHPGCPPRCPVVAGYPALAEATKRAYLRAHPRCERCPERAVAAEPIVPLQLGGLICERNLRALCASCSAIRRRSRVRVLALAPGD